MSSFTKHPSMRLLPDGESWETTEAFEYHIGSEDSNEIVSIPKGFVTDGASIPKIFWSIIGGPWGKYGYAAVVHDWLYYTKIYTRKKSDQIFLEAMEVLGVSRWKRYTMYWAVRSFSWICWNGKRKPFIPTKPIIALIIGLLLLSGCASMNMGFDKQGRLDSVDSKGIQNTKTSQEIIEEGVVIITKGDVTTKTVDKVTTKITVEREAAWKIWPENLFNIYKD